MKRLKYEIAIQNVVAHYVETKGTVRTVAKDLGISKTAVHTRIMRFIQMNHVCKKDKELADKAKQIIEVNKKEKCMRGGNSTRQKFMSLRKNKKDAKIKTK